jgi:hypothetical protein
MFTDCCVGNVPAGDLWLPPYQPMAPAAHFRQMLCDVPTKMALLQLHSWFDDMK